MNISAHKMVINVLCFTLLHKIPDHVEFISAKWKNMIYKRGVGGGGQKYNCHWHMCSWAGSTAGTVAGSRAGAGAGSFSDGLPKIIFLMMNICNYTERQKINPPDAGTAKEGTVPQHREK